MANLGNVFLIFQPSNNNNRRTPFVFPYIYLVLLFYYIYFIENFPYCWMAEICGISKYHKYKV